MSDTLFPLVPVKGPDESLKHGPRVPRPNRTQLELRPVDLDALLPADHRARLVWEFVEGLDLAPLYADIKAVEGHAGRPSIDPAILMARWLYATLEGVGSARALERLCEQHDAYRWICGGVSVNDHTRAEFRVAHGEWLDTQLTTSVATLLSEGLVDLKLVDGGFVAHDDIVAVAQPGFGCLVYAPVPEPRDPSRDRHQPLPSDPEAIREWRPRMGTERAKEIYKHRAATSECVNAIARNRGLRQFLVRGLARVKAILLWFALAHNLMRAVALRRAAAQPA